MDLDLSGAGHRAQHPGDLLRCVIERIEVRAVEVDDHRSGIPGEGFFDALGEKGFHGEVHARKLGQDLADLRLRELGLFPLERFEIHVELAVMGPPHIIRLFGPPCSLRNGADIWDVQECAGHLASQTQRFLQRGAGDR